MAAKRTQWVARALCGALAWGLSSTAQAEEGRVGATSTGRVSISVSVAAGGEFRGLAALDPADPSRGMAACLWLNTPTRLYSIRREPGDGRQPLHWSVGEERIVLGDDGSRSLLAAARPGCAPAEMTQVSAGQSPARNAARPVTLLIVPE